VALIILDASVVVAFLDPVDRHHDGAVSALEEHAAEETVLPASAYAEALVHAARMGELETVREKIKALLIRIAAIDEPVAEEAARLRARHPALRLPDALVLACGQTLEADVILTADHRWRELPRVRVLEATEPSGFPARR
jgi:predicted nucleic acid-binding protein